MIDTDTPKQVSNKPARNAKGQLLPGSTANPNGRPKDGTSLTDLLRLQANVEIEDGRTYREVMMEMILQKAAKGDLKAAEMVFDRIEGKPHQTQHNTNESTTEVRVIE